MCKITVPSSDFRVTFARTLEGLFQMTQDPLNQPNGSFSYVGRQNKTIFDKADTQI